MNSLLIERRGAVALLTMNRPGRLNALDSGLVSALHDALDEVGSDPGCRAAILTGEGRGFCAGLDLSEDFEAQHQPGFDGLAVTMALQDRIASLMEKIHRCPKPVLAAVNGPAVGGGFALALACDVRLASDSAKFGSVFIKVGASNCDMGVSYFLPRLIGASRSAELLLTGRIFDAAEAKATGLVAATYAATELVDRSLSLAAQITAHDPFQVWMTKETMWHTVDAPSLRHAIDVENRTQVMCVQSGAFLDALKGFQVRNSADHVPAGSRDGGG